MLEETTTNEPTETQDTNSVNFRELLPPEYKNLYPEFKKAEDFVKGYDSLVRKLGSSVTIPKEDAPSDELNKFYSKLGRPEEPNKYEFEINDNTKVDNDFLTKFKEVAYESGISQKQASKLFGWYNQELESVEHGYLKEQEEKVNQATEELKRRWGGDYDRKLSEVQGFAKSLAGEKIYEGLVKYGNDPDFITVMSELHDKYIAEDRITERGAVNVGVQDYSSQAMKLMSDPDYKTNTEKQQIVRDLYRKVAEQKGKR